ncbi:ATP-binding protein [Nocardioides soli]|uniref:DNA-binding SARP family transcriptional activator n=1 Tax=Nocardioides soli TaxID=1036020 RepID=A0A7W4VWL6_9ACTN|nr:AAA family ATPase [Nocardioides soli]MBB3043060.1 DNA-binding SARP family transcriptional activator [Nocardioides soli]
MSRESTSTVFVLGELEVVDPSGRALGPVPAGRAQVLLRRLVAADGAAVETGALVDALWDDDVPSTPERVIASLVSRIRKAIGADAVTGSSATGYRFNAGPAWTSDIAQLEELTRSCQARAALSPAVAVAAARRGFALLDRGQPQLGSAFAQHAWAEDQRRYVEGLTRRLHRSCWEAEAHLGMWPEIAEQAAEVFGSDPHDELAGRALIRALWHLGDRAEALRTYERLREQLREQFGVDPSPETDALFSTIVSGQDPDAPRSTDTALELDSLALIGRRVELDALVARWQRAVDGEPGVVVITGNPGAGCSTLAQALTAVAQESGARAIRVDCFEGARSSALQPLVSVLSRILLSTPPEALPALLGGWTDTATELVPELREVVGPVAYRRASPEIEHRRVLHTMRHILTASAETQPLILHFDDLHLAGAATIDAVQWLLHSDSRAPVLLVATAPIDRLDSGLRGLADTGLLVELGPLTEYDVAVLAERAGLASEAAFVWDLTQGHLMFVVDVLAALGRGERREDIPGTLRSMVLHRVRRSGSEVEGLLQAASVIGTAFAPDTLQQLVDRSPAELMNVLQTASATGLIVSRNDRFVFSPPILGRALYEDLPGPIRVLRHRQLAEILADRPELRAHHQERGGLVAAAAHSWFEAADLARRAFANADAVRLYTWALAGAREVQDHALEGEVLIGRGAAREDLADFDGATEDHLQAEELAVAVGDRKLRARAVERLGWTAYYRRDVDETFARAEEASQMPEAGPGAWNLLGRTRHWAGDFHGAHQAYERALEEMGTEDEAIRASVLSCLGALLEHADRYGDAIEVLDEAVAVSHDLGTFHPLLRGLFFAGMARANAGDLSGALTALQTKAAMLERYDVAFYRARTNTTLAWVWRELGESSRAQLLAELALSQSREVEAGSLQIEQELHALVALADSELAAGRSDLAAERLSAAQGLVDAWLPFRWRGDLRVKEVGARMGLVAPEALLVAAREAQSPKYQTLALHLMGRREEAAALARQTGSLLLLGEVGAPAEADDALRRLAASLPQQLRAGFVRAGRLPRSRA